MNKYRVKIEPRALADIQEITDWYNEKQAELGNRFQKTTIKQINSLSKAPLPVCHSIQSYPLYDY